MTTSDAGNQDKSATKSPDPQDIIYSSLTNAVGFITSANPTTIASQIAKRLDSFLASLIPLPPDDDQHARCVNPDPAVARFCAQLKFDLATAADTYANAQKAAAASLHQAVVNWNLAVSQYQLSVTTADVTLRAAVHAAVDIYEQKKSGSKSRDLFLYYTMQEAAAAASRLFEDSVAAAGESLAASAGTLIQAYVTYVTGVQVAQGVRQIGEATARATFWQNVENTQDTV